MKGGGRVDAGVVCGRTGARSRLAAAGLGASRGEPDRKMIARRPDPGLAVRRVGPCSAGQSYVCGVPRSAGLPRSAEGVVVRHSVGCPARSGGPCQCRPGFQAQVWSPRDRRTIRRTFRSSAEARAWRSQTHTALRAGTMLAPTRTTVGQAAELWLKGARSGVIRTRAGDEYMPSALRSYEQSLRTHALPRLGSLRLSAVTRTVVQDLVDELVASGFSPSTVRNAILPLRVIYRRAVGRAELVVNPTLGLAMPAVRSRRERVARPGEAAALIESTPIRDRAIWATAMYGGLRARGAG